LLQTTYALLGGIKDLPCRGQRRRTPPSPAPDAGKKRRGRPRQSITETARQRVERIQEELRQAQVALRESEEKRAVIVGTAALRHVKRNTEFARQLAAMLRAEIKSKAERATIADLMETPSDKSG
jgi:hypothetical protein